ncbi:MAG: type III pantothenate kinase [Verrucomicrobiales bacterium]|jgi:type III pantothenate kinase|nr:type III pantothenate kinase [Verrucomicrobiales bacterium]
MNTRGPLLTIDISNSWTKFGLARAHRLYPAGRVETARLTVGTLAALERQHHPRLVVIASVVPKALAVARQVWRGRRLLIVSARTPLPITLNYPHPRTIGADRIANAVATARLYPLPAIAVDSGTAVTFDIISKHREYLGGVIAPGLNAMTHYLHEKTALLPRLTLGEPRRAIGKSTVEAMQIGALTGYRGLIRGVIEVIRAELHSRRVTIIATGGHAPLLAQRAPFIHTVNTLLTLQGLQFIAEYHEAVRAEPQSHRENQPQKNSASSREHFR